MTTLCLQKYKRITFHSYLRTPNVKTSYQEGHLIPNHHLLWNPRKNPRTKVNGVYLEKKTQLTSDNSVKAWTLKTDGVMLDVSIAGNNISKYKNQTKEEENCLFGTYIFCINSLKSYFLKKTTDFSKCRTSSEPGLQAAREHLHMLFLMNIRSGPIWRKSTNPSSQILSGNGSPKLHRGVFPSPTWIGRTKHGTLCLQSRFPIMLWLLL